MLLQNRKFYPNALLFNILIRMEAQCIHDGKTHVAKYFPLCFVNSFRMGRGAQHFAFFPLVVCLALKNATRLTVAWISAIDSGYRSSETTIIVVTSTRHILFAVSDQIKRDAFGRPPFFSPLPCDASRSMRLFSNENFLPVALSYVSASSARGKATYGRHI